MNVYAATVEGERGGFCVIGVYRLEAEARRAAEFEKSKHDWIAHASAVKTTIHDVDMDMYRRQLGGQTAAANRFKQQNKELRELVADLYNAIPDEDTGMFAERVAKAVRR